MPTLGSYNDFFQSTAPSQVVENPYANTPGLYSQVKNALSSLLGRGQNAQDLGYRGPGSAQIIDNPYVDSPPVSYNDLAQDYIRAAAATDDPVRQEQLSRGLFGLATQTGQVRADDRRLSADQVRRAQRLESEIAKERAAVSKAAWEGKIPQSDIDRIWEQIDEKARFVGASIAVAPPPISITAAAQNEDPLIRSANQARQAKALITGKDFDISAFIDPEATPKENAATISSLVSAKKSMIQAQESSIIESLGSFNEQRTNIIDNIKLLESEFSEKGRYANPPDVSGVPWNNSQPEYVAEYNAAADSLTQYRSQLSNLHSDFYNKMQTKLGGNVPPVPPPTVSPPAATNEIDPAVQQRTLAAAKQTGLPYALDRSDLEQFKAQAQGSGVPVEFIWEGEPVTIDP